MHVLLLTPSTIPPAPLTVLIAHRSGDVLLHLAATYPTSSFVGYDTSARALAVARQHAAERGLGNVTFLNPEDGPQCQLPCTPMFHLMIAQEAIHDTAHPQVGATHWQSAWGRLRRAGE